MTVPGKNIKILIAPNAFKESLSAMDVAKSMQKGLARVFSVDHLFILPVADGGDGSLEVLAQVLNLDLKTFQTEDPLHRKINARMGYSQDGRQAYIEMAAATGLHLLKNKEKNAAIADSFGTGLLMRKAVEDSVQTINFFVGGTASMDGGTGILRALGFKFFDKQDREISPGGIQIGEISKFQQPEKAFYEKLKEVKLTIFCDVDNPLNGERGCVNVFGPQKDNGKTDMNELRDSFMKYSTFLKEVSGKNIDELPGGGAAGGTPAGLSAFLNTKVLRGADKILEHCGFDSLLNEVDLVITGEGKLDDQSLEGKAPAVVAQKARNKAKKVIFVGGSIPAQPDNSTNDYFDAIFSITPGPVSLEDSKRNASSWIERTSYQVAKLIQTIT